MLFLLLACQCGSPALPPETDPPTLPTRPPTPPVDTGPEPQCDWVETEPNNTAADANPLPLETQACGNFDSENGDADNWAFTVPFTTWIGIDVDAAELGSLANPAVVVSSAEVSFGRTDGDAGADVHLLVPLTGGDYNLQVLEQNLSGGTDGRWYYDVQVSEQKAPRSWNTTETEPNDALAEAMLVSDGDALYGFLDTQTDEDWYRVVVPSGRHTLRVQVEAFASGSPLDGQLYLRDVTDSSPGCADNPSCRFRRGETGFEADPFLLYTSEGDETLYVRFLSEDNDNTPFHWYVMDVVLEEGGAE